MTAANLLRCPSTHTASPTPGPSTFQSPSLDQLLGRWYISQTTSPAWRNKRNVLLTYTLLAGPEQGDPPLIDDLVEYQSLSASKLQSVRGTDTPSRANPGAWIWRGNGWLKFVTSQWEILGHGEVDGAGQWMVVYAQKSVFTPAVINVYTRRKEGLPAPMRKTIEAAFEELGHEDLRALVQSMYSVPQS